MLWLHDKHITRGFSLASSILSSIFSRKNFHLNWDIKWKRNVSDKFISWHAMWSIFKAAHTNEPEWNFENQFFSPTINVLFIFRRFHDKYQFIFNANELIILHFIIKQASRCLSIRIALLFCIFITLNFSATYVEPKWKFLIMFVPRTTN